jgi:competence protein ComEA
MCMSKSIHNLVCLRSADQVTLAMLCALFIVAMGLWSLVEIGSWYYISDVDDNIRKTACFQVDVNTADKAELNQLPGIGDVLAKRIIETRQNRGPFKSYDDLRKVKGIGPKIGERIRPYLIRFENNN